MTGKFLRTDKMCPFCLAQKPLGRRNGARYVCQEAKCGHTIPKEYAESRYPGLAAGAVGFTGHGKTTALTSLFYSLDVLMNRAEATWPGFYYRALDSNTLSNFRRNLDRFKDGFLPDPTVPLFPQPYLMTFRSVPPMDSCPDTHHIAFYDTAGAVFEDVAGTQLEEAGRFMARACVALFMVSLRKPGEVDLKADRAHHLLNIYVNAMENLLQHDLRRQHLVIVLTKADLLRELPPVLARDLRAGVLANYSSQLTAHMPWRLRWRSQEIRKWLLMNGGRGAVSLAEDKFKSVEYCLVSALGGMPINNNRVLVTPDDPKCVLDPFLWVLLKAAQEHWDIPLIVRSFLKGLFS